MGLGATEFTDNNQGNPSMKRQFVLICNEHSGSAVAASELRHLFAIYGVTVTILDITDGLAVLCKKVAIINPEVIVASGGDGTVNTCADIALQTRVVLAVLPTGTFNHFTKDLQIPQDLRAAVKVAVQGKVARLDYADVNGRVFVNSSSIGAYPKAVLTREQLQPGLSKMVAMALGILSVTKQNRSLRITLALTKSSITIASPSLFIGNNVFDMSGFGAPTRRHINKGKLCVFVVRAGRLRNLFLTAIFLLIGKKHANLAYFETSKQIRIDSSQSSTLVSLDGEVVTLAFPLVYTLHKKALPVCVPVSVPAETN